MVHSLIFLFLFSISTVYSYVMLMSSEGKSLVNSRAFNNKLPHHFHKTINKAASGQFELRAVFRSKLT